MDILTDEHGDRIEVDQPAVFAMVRGDKEVAQVVVLPGGKCIVAWPTSVIVYDSERAARAVHIEHIKGRGEPTSWRLVWATDGFSRGFVTCYQDRCEGVPESSGPKAPDYVPEHQRADYERGYLSCGMDLWGTDWRPQAKEVR